MLSSFVFVLCVFCCASALPQAGNNLQDLNGQSPQDDSARQEIPLNADDISKAMLRFALDFHKIVATGEAQDTASCYTRSESTEPTENAIFSPLSLANALAVFWRGGSGSTAEQIRKALRFPEVSSSNREFHALYGQLLDKVFAPGRNVTLDFASTVFGNLGVHVFTRFFEDAETYYRTLFRAVDFANNPEEAKEHINIFVANVTRDSIKDLVRQAPDPNTLLMLVNAVYFNGNWEIPFEEEYTEDRPFHVSAEETLEVPTLFNVLELPYYENREDGFEIVGLPYRGRKFHYYILLPKEGYTAGLEALERKLTPELLLDSIEKLERYDFSFSMPKMDISERFDLRPYFQGLGICDLFNPGIDLTGMTKENLLVSDAVHQAKITVNEVGTEAAAATSFTTTRSSQSLSVDRPFMFVIMDSENQVPVFMGRVVRPKV